MADFDVRARRKDRVEMRGEHHDFFFVHAAQFADHIADGVDLNVQAGSREKSLKRCRALAFLKRRRGNFGETHLLLIDPIQIGREPSQCRAHLRVFAELEEEAERVLCRAREERTGIAKRITQTRTRFTVLLRAVAVINAVWPRSRAPRFRRRSGRELIAWRHRKCD